MNKIKNKIFILSMLLIVLLSCSWFVGVGVIKTVEGEEQPEDAVEVTFFNVAMGDCTFIKYNDVEILIDSGQIRKGSTDLGVKNASQIVEVIGEKIEGDLDYVIVTHGDQDHLENMEIIFSGLLLKGKRITNIIDFDSLYYEAFYMAKNEPDKYYEESLQTVFESRANNPECDVNISIDEYEETKDNKVLRKYTQKRDEFVKIYGTKYYCVAERLSDEIAYTPIFKFDQEKSSNAIFTHDDFELQILYNKNYFDLLNKEDMESAKSSQKISAYFNAKSVCSLIKFGKSKILFTGDLYEVSGNKKMEGEANLIETYKESGLLENITLYKAAHHGSDTSNSKAFIQHIKPKYVAISGMANSDSGKERWGFPRQSALDNLRMATENIYITGCVNRGGLEQDYYGTITFTLYKDERVSVKSSVEKGGTTDNQEIYDDSDALKPLKDTQWFKENRTTKMECIVFSGYQDESCAFQDNCALVKYGPTEVLINCGNRTTGEGPESNITRHLVEKIKNYCLDGTIEYVIVSSPRDDNINQLVYSIKNNEKQEKGIFDTFKVGNLIDFGNTYDPSEGTENSTFARYDAMRKAIGSGWKSKDGVQSGTTKIAENFSFTILKNEYYGKGVGDDKFDASVCLLVEFFGEKMLFMGDVRRAGAESVLNSNDNLSDISFYLPADFANSSSNYRELLKKIKGNSKKLFIAVNGIADGNDVLNEDMIKRFTAYGNVYFTTELDSSGDFNEVCGDLTFYVIEKNGKIVEQDVAGSVNTVEIRDTDYYSRIFG